MMLHSHSDTHLPLLPCPSFRCREKLKQVDPRLFCFFCFSLFLSSLFFFPFLHTGPSLSVYLSSFFFLPPTLVVIAWVRMGVTTGSGMNPLLAVIHHIPQLTAASAHSHFHLCISHGRLCVACGRDTEMSFKTTEITQLSCIVTVVNSILPYSTIKNTASDKV